MKNTRNTMLYPDSFEVPGVELMDDPLPPPPPWPPWPTTD
jgi:hypothetical protein